MVQTRLAKRKIEDPDGVASTSLNASVVHSLESSDEEDPVPKKRRRQTRKTTKKVAPSKRRRGRKELCQLNLDVLFLIAEYIHPVDLLNLSRTCKSLRILLMDKSSTFVWKTARGQIKYLPDCPSDLTEPEYANLVFYARCHGCGKYAPTIFWKMRRRYCPGCRFERFIRYPGDSCGEIIRQNDVLAYEYHALEKEAGTWYDKEQVNSFVDEYNKSADKVKFLQDRKVQYQAIKVHARQCEDYQRIRARERRDTLDERRRNRQRDIFERLKQCGYEAEIGYHTIYTIKDSYPNAFKTSKPLKDRDWDLMLPRWLGIMKDLRKRRLEKDVYQSRRRILASEYKHVVQNPPDDLNPAYIIPHVADLANLPAFSAITRAPEETPHDNYASAFAQLPNIVEDWMQGAVTELRNLIDIPSDCQPSETVSASDQAESSNSESTSLVGLSSREFGKLQLACALFCVDGLGAYTYSNALSRSRWYSDYPSYEQTESEPATGSIADQLRISFLSEAPYIVHACGLDPSVATADDMDQRNARLSCLHCKSHTVMSWRAAVYHASYFHRHNSPRSDYWQLISDAHINAIQAVEKPSTVTSCSHPKESRCLLCRQHIGDALNSYHIADHLVSQHQLERNELKAGVHYAPLDIRFITGVCCLGEVIMVEEEGNVAFKSQESMSLAAQVAIS